MSLIYCEQRSEEWFQLHVGRVTASSVRDVLNFKKTGDKGPGAKRIAYMGNKVAEILTGMQGLPARRISRCSGESTTKTKRAAPIPLRKRLWWIG